MLFPHPTFKSMETEANSISKSLLELGQGDCGIGKAMGSVPEWLFIQLEPELLRSGQIQRSAWLVGACRCSYCTAVKRPSWNFVLFCFVFYLSRETLHRVSPRHIFFAGLGIIMYLHKNVVIQPTRGAG